MRLRTRQLVEVSTIVIAVGLVFAALFLLLFELSSEILTASAKAKSEANAELLASRTKAHLLAGSLVKAHVTLKRFRARHEEVTALALLDARGRPFVQIGKVGRSRSLPDKQNTLSVLEDGVVRSVSAIYNGKQRIGYAVYQESLAGALRYRRTIGTFALVGSLILILLIPLATLLSFRRILHGIASLATATQAARSGNLSVRVPVHGEDEITALSEQFNRMLEELEQSRQQQGEQIRLKREMELAERVQTSLLPPMEPVGSLLISGRMIPAEEVGGDYYDLLPTQGDRCWLAIGDVSGHGLSSGLVMMMVQTAISTATSRDPEASPSTILALVNRVVHANVRGRWGTSHHMTLTLFRYDGGGRFQFAGAHEDILVYRAAKKEVDVIPTRGTWIGAIEDVSRVMPQSEVTLEPGDRMVLFTDGVIEASSQDRGEQFGVGRLVDVVNSRHSATPDRLVDDILTAVRKFTPRRNDDQTVVVVQNAPIPAGGPVSARAAVEER
jgi:serine phosphatase RsbU (regulator of sigma subunit)